MFPLSRLPTFATLVIGALLLAACDAGGAVRSPTERPFISSRPILRPIIESFAFDA